MAAVLAWRTADASPEPEPVNDSYRGTIVIASALSVSVAALGMGTESGPLFAVGAAGFVVGAPLIHMSRGRYGRAAASAGVRLALPAIGLVAGDSLPRDCGPSPCANMPPALYIGLGAGVVAATVIDAVFLAKSDARGHLTPVAAPTRDGFAFGVAGIF